MKWDPTGAIHEDIVSSTRHVRQLRSRTSRDGRTRVFVVVCAVLKAALLARIHMFVGVPTHQLFQPRFDLSAGFH